MLYPVRYLLTLVAELVYSYSTRQNIEVLGHTKGSFGAYLDWCHTTAVWCAHYRHPLRLCLDRKAWEEWMMTDDQKEERTEFM